MEDRRPGCQQYDDGRRVRLGERACTRSQRPRLRSCSSVEAGSSGPVRQVRDWLVVAYLLLQPKPVRTPAATPPRTRAGSPLAASPRVGEAAGNHGPTLVILARGGGASQTANAAR